jgi:ankyrin repeat protein
MSWIFYARRTLTIQELIDIIRFHDETKNRADDLETLLRPCCGLVQEHLGLDTVSFTHLSVREYIECHDEPTRDPVPGEIPGQLLSEHDLAIECIEYLMQHNRNNSLSGRTGVDDRNVGFYGYAASFWGYHALCINHPPSNEHDVSHVTTKLRGLVSEYLVSSNLHTSIRRTKSGSLSVPTPRTSSWMHTASHFGLLWALGNVGPRSERVRLVNQQDESGSTALHVAARQGFSDCARWLLHNLCAAGSIRDGSGKTWMHLAAASDSSEMETLILEQLDKGVDPDGHNTSEETLLHVAALHGRSALFRSLVAALSREPKFKSLRNTLMRPALRGGNFDVVLALLDTGIEITSDQLADAIVLGFEAAVQLFIDAGIDINAAAYGQARSMPIHIATVSGRLPILKRLMGAGADIEVENSKGHTALALAVVREDMAVIKVLLDAGANATVCVYGDESSLAYAYRRKNDELISLLHEAGAVSAESQLQTLQTRITSDSTGIEELDDDDLIPHDGMTNHQGATSSEGKLRTSETVYSAPPTTGHGSLSFSPEEPVGMNLGDKKVLTNSPFNSLVDVPALTTTLSYDQPPTRRAPRTIMGGKSRSWLLLDNSIEEDELALGMVVADIRNPKARRFPEDVGILKTMTDRHICDYSERDFEMYSEQTVATRLGLPAIFAYNAETHKSQGVGLRAPKVNRLILENPDAVTRQILENFKEAVREGMFIVVGLMVVRDGTMSRSIDSKFGLDLEANISGGLLPVQGSSYMASIRETNGQKDGSMIYAVQYRKIIRKGLKGLLRHRNFLQLGGYVSGKRTEALF